MNTVETLHLLPYLASLGISLVALLYAWSRRNTQGTRTFIWYAGGQSLWIFAFILEVMPWSLQGKIFWHGIQWLGELISIVAFPVFAAQYSEYPLRNARLFFRLSLIVPILFAFLLATDGLHHLIYANPHARVEGVFVELEYGRTPILYAISVYRYLVAFIGIAFLIQHFRRSHILFRTQITVILIGFLIPIIGNFLNLAGIHFPSGVDIHPMAIALGSLVMSWGLYRFRIFDIKPVGRDKVFEDMLDPVVILGNDNLVVDINRSMLDLLGRNVNEVIGQPAKEIFADYSIPIRLYLHVTHARADSAFELSGNTVHYELTVSPLYSHDKKLVGRIYILHDITSQKALEHNLRKLNLELEDRVLARTEELYAAYDYTLEGWAKALEFRDEETEGHSRRVTEMTLKIARALEIPQDELVHIRRGALLHDIGKMSIPDKILHKPGKLTDEERNIIKKHPETAYKLLSPIPFLKKALVIPYSHHEKWDGTGYPQGLKEKDIPLAARIFAIADVWDALSSNRPYNQAWPREKIIAYFIEQSGRHFDPFIINIFLGLIDKGGI
ncbi:MAG: HD domain-containing protein [Chloroflexi bacterium]|nr:HD domain-containing protein [Chloroflexota bacterium]